MTIEFITKHLEGEHDQRDHGNWRSMVFRGWLEDTVAPFFFTGSKGKHAKPPSLNWWGVFDDQMESAKDDRTKLRGPIPVGNDGAYFIPMSTEPGSGDGYFHTSSGKRLWGRYGAAGVMVRSRNKDGAPVYLLAKRSASITGGGGTWAVPGGAIDEGEDPEQGALRELAEEVGDVPQHLNYKPVAADRNELEDGWAYTTVLAEVDEPFDVEAKDWETEKGGWGWFTEGQIKQMTLHPAMKDRLEVLFALWKHKGGAHAKVDKHLPGLHNQKSHGGDANAPWILDGGGFLNQNEWEMHKWAYAYNIDGYKNDYDAWHLQTFNDAYLPWEAPDEKLVQPQGAPDPDPPNSTTPAETAEDWVEQLIAGGQEPSKPSAKGTPGGVPGLTIIDRRKKPNESPLTFDAAKLATIYQVDEIPATAKVALYINDAQPGKPYGSTMHKGKDEFTVHINLKPLPEVAQGTSVYPDAALYVINNTLVHELRHVAQHYIYPSMDSDYGKESAANGYDGNFYEKEAWLWGHYADQTGEKGTTTDYKDKTITLPPPPDGFNPYDVWAFTPPGWTPPTSGRLKAAKIPSNGLEVYRTEKAHEAYKGKASWGAGTYYGLDKAQVGEMQLDPEREDYETNYWTPEMGGVDAAVITPKARLAEIFVDDLNNDDLQKHSGESLRNLVLQAGFDGVIIHTESANFGGNQVVIYQTPKGK